MGSGYHKVAIPSSSCLEAHADFFRLLIKGPHLMRIHLVRYSTSVRFEKYSNIHLVRPIIHLV